MKTCIILAQIKSVDTSIYYLCCQICLSKVCNFNRKYICKKCNHEIDNPSPHYKLCFEIFDGSALTRVNIFGKVLNKFIGTNAYQFLRWKKMSLLNCNINEQQLNEIFNQNLKKYFVNEWFYFKFNLKNTHQFNHVNLKNSIDNKFSMNIMNLKNLLIIHQEFKFLNVVNFYKTAKLGTFTTIIQKTNIILKKRKQRKLESFYKNSYNAFVKNSLSKLYKDSLNVNEKSNIHISSNVESTLRKSHKKCADQQNFIINVRSSSALNSLVNNSINSEPKINLTNSMMSLFEHQAISDKNYIPSGNFSLTENILNSITNIKGNNDLILNLNTSIDSNTLFNELTSIVLKFPKNISNITCINNESYKLHKNEMIKDNKTVTDVSILNKSQDLFSPNVDKRNSFFASTPMMLIKKLKNFDDNRIQSPILSNNSICATLCLDGSIDNLHSNILRENNHLANDEHCNKIYKDKSILLEDYLKNHSPILLPNKFFYRNIEDKHHILISQPINFNFSSLFANESKSIFQSNYNHSDDLFE